MKTCRIINSLKCWKTENKLQRNFKVSKRECHKKNGNQQRSPIGNVQRLCVLQAFGKTYRET